MVAQADEEKEVCARMVPSLNFACRSWIQQESESHCFLFFGLSHFPGSTESSKAKEKKDREHHSFSLWKRLVEEKVFSCRTIKETLLVRQPSLLPQRQTLLQENRKEFNGGYKRPYVPPLLL